LTPTPTLTPTVTSTPTSTPTPTQYCSGKSVDVSATTITISISPTPTKTPTPTPLPFDVPIAGTVTYNSFEQFLLCPISKKLVDCNSDQIFYVTGSLGEVPIGAVVSVYINNISYCVTYVDVVSTAPTHSLTSVASVDLLNCVFCTPGISPSPTPTYTPTPTPSSTLTPTPSLQAYTYIYRVCRSYPLSPIIVIQTQPVPNVSLGQGFVSSSTSPSQGKKATFINVIPGWNPSYPSDIVYTGNYFGSAGSISDIPNCPQ